jgi:hypothetical protein
MSTIDRFIALLPKEGVTITNDEIIIDRLYGVPGHEDGEDSHYNTCVGKQLTIKIDRVHNRLRTDMGTRHCKVDLIEQYFMTLKSEQLRNYVKDIVDQLWRDTFGGRLAATMYDSIWSDKGPLVDNETKLPL